MEWPLEICCCIAEESYYIARNLAAPLKNPVALWRNLDSHLYNPKLHQRDPKTKANLSKLFSKLDLELGAEPKHAIQKNSHIVEVTVQSS